MKRTAKEQSIEAARADLCRFLSKTRAAMDEGITTEILGERQIARIRNGDFANKDAHEQLTATVFFLTRALAECATSNTPTNERRAAMAYELGSIALQAVQLLRIVLPAAGGCEAAPDCGLLRTAKGAVEALHEAIHQNPEFFANRWAAHYLAWPVLVAKNGKILSRCYAPNEVGLLSVLRLPEKTKRKRGDRRPDLSAMFTGIAVEMAYYVWLYGRYEKPSSLPRAEKTNRKRGDRNPKLSAIFPETDPIHVALPPLRIGTAGRWRRAIKAELKSRRVEVLARPEVKRWASTRTGKSSRIWNELETQILRCIASMARG